MTFCFIKHKIITPTRSQISDTILPTQHKKCLNCYSWLLKNVWNIKTLCRWIINWYIQWKNKLDYSKINWTDIFIAVQDTCSFVLGLCWDKLCFACAYFVCTPHLQTATEFAASQSDFLHSDMLSMENFYGTQWLVSCEHLR